ncbi:MAG TPA: SDR family NAD(P)-dependent oxidoreductase [Candidatus Eisenbacteria bacterium]|nr:SDR family NAD(P)-dependent oxidoreductase [Candidatus Eisenbacteria bacterium]
MRKTLVIGATSAIGMASAKLFAADGDRLFLVARDESKLSAAAASLRSAGADVAGTFALDLNDCGRHPALLDEARRALAGLDLLFVCYGVLGRPDEYAGNFRAVEEVLKTNFTNVVSLLTHAAGHFEKQRSGSIAVVTSVAGDRGRKGNFVYGASKAGLDVYLQGLRGRMRGFGVHVLTIKPGYVATPMTAHLSKSALFSSPEAVASGIRRAIRAKKQVVYVPGYWRWIMFLVRRVPEGLI